MSSGILKLHLRNFRNYSDESWVFESKQVVLTGPNGSGKSNVLESIFFAGILRSFRTAALRDLYKLGEKFFCIELALARNGYTEKLRIEQHVSGQRILQIDNVGVAKSSDFINEFRAVAFAPEDKEITAGASGFRRRFMDMFISVLDKSYLAALRNYSLALRNRNLLLKQSQAHHSGVFSSFEQIMAESAAVIGELRLAYTAKLQEKFRHLLPGWDFAARYEPSFPLAADECCQWLEKAREKDMKRGFTSGGPQSDDWIYLLDGKELRHYGSSGQLRLASLYLKMAEFLIIREQFDGQVVALVDDVTGELDEVNCGKFLNTVNLAEQIFYTFTELPRLSVFAGAQHLAVAGPEVTGKYGATKRK